tara:strand:+ start:249 stop:473 length:225 start_codon:yes stop_codon:yes gene_type:complete
MQFGYVLCSPKRDKVLLISKDTGVKLVPSCKDNIDKAFCLNDMSSVKSIYEKLREKKLVGKLEVANIQELYRSV